MLPVTEAVNVRIVREDDLPCIHSKQQRRSSEQVGRESMCVKRVLALLFTEILLTTLNERTKEHAKTLPTHQLIHNLNNNSKSINKPR